MRVDFTWGPSGSIDVVTHFQAVPDVTLSFSSDSMDQTVMAAFVLLVLLTAAQAGVVATAVWSRLQRATSSWKIILVGSAAGPVYLSTCLHTDYRRIRSSRV